MLRGWLDFDRGTIGRLCTPRYVDKSERLELRISLAHHVKTTAWLSFLRDRVEPSGSEALYAAQSKGAVVHVALPFQLYVALYLYTLTCCLCVIRNVICTASI